MFATHNLLTSFLDSTATRIPEALAARDADLSLSYGALRDAAAHIAARLAEHGVTAGDRVILAMPNSVAFMAGFWGIITTGAIAVPLNPGTPCGKFAFILEDCTPAAAIADASTADVLRRAMEASGRDLPLLADNLLARGASGRSAPAWPAPQVIDQDMAAIIYTSGSTGTPKGVMLTHLNMTSAARSVASYLGYCSGDTIFCAVPMTFDYGLHQITMAALTGASVYAADGFAQPLFALRQLARSRASVFPVVPSMVPMIAPLADRFDLRSVRLATSTAAALHPQSIDQLQAALPAASVFSMYGLTECHRCTYLPPALLETHRGSVGIAIPNTEMWVVDDDGVAHRRGATGELVIRGATVMKGYWNNPEATALRLRPGPNPGERVLYTGDTCRLDADGFLYFVARNDDILKIRGEKVAPSEVETALIAHPDVVEICALGEKHAVHGQICVAHLSLRNGSGVDVETLLGWARAHLDPHAVPSRIIIHETMPRTPNGKLDRAGLRDRSASSGDRPVRPSRPARPARPAVPDVAPAE